MGQAALLDLELPKKSGAARNSPRAINWQPLPSVGENRNPKSDSDSFYVGSGVQRSSLASDSACPSSAEVK
jgi:hypothetical protein